MLGLTGLAQALPSVRPSEAAGSDSPPVPVCLLPTWLAYGWTQVSRSCYPFPSEMASKGTHTSQREEARPTCHNRRGLRSMAKTNGGRMAAWKELS